MTQCPNMRLFTHLDTSILYKHYRWENTLTCRNTSKNKHVQTGWYWKTLL